MTLISVQPLPGEPIFVYTFDALLTTHDIAHAFEETNARWEDHMLISGMHNILLLASVTADFNIVMTALHMHADEFAKNGTVRRHVHQYVVGNGLVASLFSVARKLPQFGGQLVPVFTSEEEAVAAARTAIKNHTSVEE